MAELLLIAAEQFGLFTRAQAHRCGVSDRMLQRRVLSGALDQLSRHLYRVRGCESSRRQQILAACLGGGDLCVASHRTAAALHGLDAFRVAPIEVTVPRGRRYRTPVAIVHESLDLVEADCCYVGPIPVTTPTRTLIDLGAVSRWQRVEEAFDGAERDELAARETVERRHGEIRKRGRRGVGPMAVVLEQRPATTPKSVLERRFLRLLEDASLPTPERQYRLCLANGRIAYLDMAYPDLRLGFELDGHGSHATRRQRGRDSARANAIADLGWHLRRFTWEQVTREAPYVLRAVRAAINGRSCDV